MERRYYIVRETLINYVGQYFKFSFIYTSLSHLPVSGPGWDSLIHRISRNGYCCFFFVCYRKSGRIHAVICLWLGIESMGITYYYIRVSMANWRGGPGHRKIVNQRIVRHRECSVDASFEWIVKFCCLCRFLLASTSWHFVTIIQRTPFSPHSFHFTIVCRVNSLCSGSLTSHTVGTEVAAVDFRSEE